MSILAILMGVFTCAASCLAKESESELEKAVSACNGELQEMECLPYENAVLYHSVVAVSLLWQLYHAVSEPRSGGQEPAQFRLRQVITLILWGGTG